MRCVFAPLREKKISFFIDGEPAYWQKDPAVKFILIYATACRDIAWEFLFETLGREEKKWTVSYLWKVDGKRVDILKPYDPGATEYKGK